MPDVTAIEATATRMRKDIVEMFGEAFRETAVLVVVFAPLDRWVERRLIFRTACGRFTDASHDGGRRIPGGCRFRNPCGRRPQRWPENTGYSEPPRF